MEIFRAKTSLIDEEPGDYLVFHFDDWIYVINYYGEVIEAKKSRLYDYYEIVDTL